MTLTALQSPKKPWVHLVVWPEKNKPDPHHLVSFSLHRQIDFRSEVQNQDRALG